jgi:hypothetical protein
MRASSHLTVLAQHKLQRGACTSGAHAVRRWLHGAAEHAGRHERAASSRCHAQRRRWQRQRREWPRQLEPWHWQATGIAAACRLKRQPLLRGGPGHNDVACVAARVDHERLECVEEVDEALSLQRSRAAIDHVPVHTMTRTQGGVWHLACTAMGIQRSGCLHCPQCLRADWYIEAILSTSIPVNISRYNLCLAPAART